MYKHLTSILITACLFTVVHAQVPTPLEIIRRVDANERLQSSTSSGRQIIITSSGSERTLEMDMFSKDENEKQLTVYTGPARVAGDKILMLNDGDDIWFYTPKTDRVRHLASHARRQKVQGSDISYEDMAMGKIEEDFTYTLLDEEDVEGAACYKFELVPTESGPSYVKMTLWVEKEKYVTRQVAYYDENGLLKRFTCTDVRSVAGHWVAFRMVMENLRDGGETVIEIDEMEVNIELNDRLFTTNELQRH